jgi:DNA-binding response OmpR family regulator
MSRIAVVEHDPELLTLLQEMLALQGWDVLTCSDAEDAFALVKQRRPDLVILDTWLDTPAAGWDLLGRLSGDAATWRIPVIVCSGEVEAFDGYNGGLKERVAAFLQKPFELDDLYRSVAVALA